jgi:hypothetical protein
MRDEILRAAYRRQPVLRTQTLVECSERSDDDGSNSGGGGDGRDGGGDRDGGDGGDDGEEGATKHQLEVGKLLELMGATLPEHIKELKKSAERRPFLAKWSNFSRDALQAVPGHTILNYEYEAIKLHAMYPGPFNPALYQD